MPTKANITKELYEAIRNGNGVNFEITTGGVRYKAVLEHRETREAREASAQSSTAASPAEGMSRQASQESFRERKIARH